MRGKLVSCWNFTYIEYVSDFGRYQAMRYKQPRTLSNLYKLPDQWIRTVRCWYLFGWLVLLSFSRKGLQIWILLDICYRYSCKWRFLYNPAKCSVVAFNETKHEFSNQTCTWLVVPFVVGWRSRIAVSHQYFLV